MSFGDFLLEKKWINVTVGIDYIKNLSALKVNLTNRGKLSLNIAKPIGENFDWKNAVRIDLDFNEITKLELLFKTTIESIMNNKITSANKVLFMNNLILKLFPNTQNQFTSNDRVFSKIFHKYNNNISTLNFIKPTDVSGNKIGTLFSLHIYKYRNNEKISSQFYPLNFSRMLWLLNVIKTVKKDILFLSSVNNKYAYTNNYKQNNITTNNTNVNIDNVVEDDF